ncbi:MAG: thioredoxin family protein [Firmicutes bacterium]|nr:thioredoxin family protein [Bacillota bacterium]
MKILILIMCLFMFTGCDNAKMNPTDTTGGDTVDYSSEYYEIINVEKFKEIYANENPTLIYFGANWCSNCQNFKPIAQKFAKEKQIKVYFVQTDALTEEEQTELYELVEFQYIPFITVYKNKEKLYGETGVHSYEELESLAQQYNINE